MKIDENTAREALGGAEQRKVPSWKIPLFLTLVAVAIGAGIYAFLAGPTVEEMQGNIQGNTYSPSADTSRARITIDGSDFSIPANYTMHRRSRKSGDHENVPMHALLPNLEPWSAIKAQEFSSNLEGSRVVRFTLSVDRDRMPYEEKFERGIRPRANNENGEPGPYGLTRYRFEPGTGYEGTEWYSATMPGGKMLVMRCDPSANTDFGSTCIRVTRLDDGIGLTYRFKRSQLEYWKETDARIMALIASFRPRK
jgi:hypothetical protein